MVLTGAVYPKWGKSLNSTEQTLKGNSDKAFAAFTKRKDVATLFKQLGMAGSEKSRPERSKEEIERLDKAWWTLTPKVQAHMDKMSFASANILYVDRWNLMRAKRPFFSQASANASAESIEDDYDITTALMKHPYSITVINGDHDLVDFGNHRWEYLSSKLKNVSVITIKNAAHNMWVDQPENFRKILDLALSK